MASLHTGSDELVYIQTDKVSVTIKGCASHPNFSNVAYNDGESALKVLCSDKYDLSIEGCADTNFISISSKFSSRIYAIKPVFFEQQRYEIIIEAAGLHTLSFWHDNLNVRSKVTRSSKRSEILSGIISFSNDIGFSDLVIQLDGQEYMRIVIEVFPTKISYKQDYQNIIADVTCEIYNLVFDFLKKTYSGYQQNDRTSSSPVEFFAVINKIFSEFIKSVDIILTQPHHVLAATHEVMLSHKVKRTDTKTLQWIEKHTGYITKSADVLLASHALAVRKTITFDTKENRFAKYIIQSTIRKLEMFKRNYQKLQRDDDLYITNKINSMISGLDSRSSMSFLKQVTAHEASSGMSLVFSMAPGYRGLYKCYLMLLHGLSISGDIFHISVKDLAVLYEYWCFIKLNSLMRNRYELVSQDIIKAQGNGLFVSLIKGKGSRVKYRSPDNGEDIVLSYNPKAIDVPTVAQRPDNVLTLEKRGADVQYEYVFDAKYRINPALPESDYYNAVSHMPGPEVSDINTMHRYRDAIVYRNGASPFERTMFGAYVLFPYSNEEEYKNHRFYQSISKVNIGGLPFLPSSVKLVSDMLDELISDSPESAFERATLPRGIEEKLAKTDWSKRDVLVGGLRSREQFDVCISKKFYHIPISKINEDKLPIHYIAIYQSKAIFGCNAGIRYYGEVTKCSCVPRSQIIELPKGSDELYYRFDVSQWIPLSKSIIPKEIRFINIYTNMFLLQHSLTVPELQLRSEEEYRLYSEFKRALNNAEINDDTADIGFKFNDSLVVFENGKICVYKHKRICARYDVIDFNRSPNAVFRRIKKDILP